jgi:hypothetical protein
MLSQVVEGHLTALNVIVNLLLHPAPPSGIAERDTFSVKDAHTVLGTKLLDVEYPAASIFHPVQLP